MRPAPLVGLVEANRRELERRRRPWRDRFPAVLTSTDGAGAYAWTEQAYEATKGNRYTKPNGRTGTTSWMPAYPFGDGRRPAETDLPLEVWLRRTLDSSAKGPVFEFPWYCACEPGSGSEGEGSGSRAMVTTACCPGGMPATVYATLFPGNSSANPCLTGMIIPLAHVGSDTFKGTAPMPSACGLGAGRRGGFTLVCLGEITPGVPAWDGSAFTVFNEPPGNNEFDFNSFASYDVGPCDPFSLSAFFTLATYGFYEAVITE
jgi:hypothetical protein